MFETIVVPVDGTEHTEVAVHPAIALAIQGGARLVFLSVAQPDGVEERRDYLRGLARGTFLPSEAEVATEGSVASVIVAAAAAHAPSLVCMASHGRGPLGLAFFGATSANVVRALGAPVVVAGPHCSNQRLYSEVVAAVGADEASEQVLPAAVALAQRIDAKLQIVQVVDPKDLRAAEEAGVPASDVRESGRVAKLAAELATGGVHAGWDVLHDHDPAHGLLAYLADYPNAIVAMATSAGSGLSLLAEGSVANHVVHRSSNPVLLLHT